MICARHFQLFPFQLICLLCRLQKKIHRAHNQRLFIHIEMTLLVFKFLASQSHKVSYWKSAKWRTRSATLPTSTLRFWPVCSSKVCIVALVMASRLGPSWRLMSSSTHSITNSSRAPLTPVFTTCVHSILVFNLFLIEDKNPAWDH